MNVSLYQAASALNAMDRWQETIAENLAASNVPGFKKQEFSFSGVNGGSLNTAAHGAAGANQTVVMPYGAARTNFEQGALRPTGVRTDLAVEGKAFFEVQLPNGGTAYTRDGEFHVSAQGQLVTKQGFVVLGDTGPITLDPNNHSPITISATGEISQGTEPKGRIKLTEFNDPSLLTAVGGGNFVGTSPNLRPIPSTSASVRQGFLEAANVSVAREMTSLIGSMRIFEANQRMAQMNDERVGQAIRDLAPQG